MINTENRLPQVEQFVQNRWESKRIRRSPEAISPELKKMVERISQVSGRWNPVEIYSASPTSLKVEKEKFLAAVANGESYNPTFEYDLAEQMDVSAAREKLQTLLDEIRIYKPKNVQERLFRIALYGKIRDDLATCDLVDGIKGKDETKIQRAFGQKYPGLDSVLLASAEEMYLDSCSPNKKTVSSEKPLLTPSQQDLLKKTSFNAEQIKAAFEWVLNKYGMLRTDEQSTGFKVVISDRATSIDVRDKSIDPMTIFIPDTRILTGDKLLGLINHEIEGHARQSMNGVELFGIGGGALKIDDETLYEGLAKRLDESFFARFFGDFGATPDPVDTFAVKMAEEGASFYEIFQDQYERRTRVALKISPDKPIVIDPEKDAKEMEEVKRLTWITTYRIMRGHLDMSNPLKFAMSKDLAYLRGWLMDKQLREAGYGGINEMAIMQTGGLQLIARLGINDADIPHPYQDFTKEYCFSVMLPNIENQLSSKNPQ